MARRAWPYLLLAPSLMLLAAFTYLPIIRVAWDSLHDKVHGASATLFVGLRNYSDLFADKAFFVTGKDKASITPFLLKKDAEAFAGKSGGKVVGFDDALKMVAAGG